MSLTSFFWKYMFFEQSSLFFTLLTLYFSVRYWKTPGLTYLIGIAISACLGGATDWYGGYLIFGYIYLFFVREKKHVWPTFWAYVVGECLGLGT